MAAGKGVSLSAEPYFGLKGGWLTFWITLSCSTDMALFGYDQGVFSGVVISQDYLDTLDLNGPSKTNLLAIITSIYDIGCFFGAVVAFTIGERLGRKKTILVGTTVMAVGAVLQVSAFHPAHMIVGRIVGGIGNGMNTSTAPVWQTETSPPKWRGKLVILDMMMNIFGYVMVSWINYGLSFVGGAIVWRLPLALQFVFIFILWSTTPWLPESPRWLIAHDRFEEATQVLADIANTSTSDAFVVANRGEIFDSVEYERNNALQWRDLITNRTTDGTKAVRRLLLGAGTQAMQQLGGINIASYYMPTLLSTSVGLSDKMSRLITACASLVYLAASGAAAPLVERLGRRVMMMTSTAVQLFCFFMMTILFYYAQKPGYAGQEKVAEASVVLFFLYYIGFGLGMLGIPWLYPTEINSLPMRTQGSAIATAVDWLMNFIVVEITPISLQSIGWKFYIIWTCTNAAFLPILYLFYPETADRTLEDLDAYYRDDPSLIVIRDADAISRKRPVRFVEMEAEDVQKAADEVGHAVHHEEI